MSMDLIDYREVCKVRRGAGEVEEGRRIDERGREATRKRRG